MSAAPNCLRIGGRRVIVEYVAPPIPIRTHDYCARFDDNDIGDPQGYGSTALEATEDLYEKVTGEQP